MMNILKSETAQWSPFANQKGGISVQVTSYIVLAFTPQRVIQHRANHKFKCIHDVPQRSVENIPRCTWHRQCSQASAKVCRLHTAVLFRKALWRAMASKNSETSKIQLIKPTKKSKTLDDDAGFTLWQYRNARPSSHASWSAFNRRAFDLPEESIG